jgi:hypothetical protein
MVIESRLGAKKENSDVIELPRNLGDAAVYKGGVRVRRASRLDFAILTKKDCAPE